MVRIWFKLEEFVVGVIVRAASGNTQYNTIEILKLCIVFVFSKSTKRKVGQAGELIKEVRHWEAHRDGLLQILRGEALCCLVEGGVVLLNLVIQLLLEPLRHEGGP